MTEGMEQRHLTNGASVPAKALGFTFGATLIYLQFFQSNNLEGENYMRGVVFFAFKMNQYPVKNILILNASDHRSRFAAAIVASLRSSALALEASAESISATYAK